MNRQFLALMVLAATSGLGNAQQPQKALPSPSDLKAAYCLGVFKTFIENLDQTLNTDSTLPEDSRKWMLAKRESTEASLERVRRYLIPRVKYLDSFALLGATKSGEDDATQFFLDGKRCDQTTRSIDEHNKCIQSDALRRANSCNDLSSYLPY